MKKLIILALLVSTPALADFDSDFANFQKDFDRLNSMVVVKKQKPKPKTVVVQQKQFDDIDQNTPDENEVDPTSPDRLGHQLENDEMRQKVTVLYQNPNIKVYSYVLQAE